MESYIGGTLVLANLLYPSRSNAQIPPLQPLVPNCIRHSIRTIRIRYTAMPRTRRHRSRLPHRLLRAHEELDRSTIDHNVIVFIPIPRPVLPIDEHGLYVIASIRIIQIMRNDSQRRIIVDRHVNVAEPRAFQQIYRLASQLGTIPTSAILTSYSAPLHRYCPAHRNSHHGRTRSPGPATAARICTAC